MLTARGETLGRYALFFLEELMTATAESFQDLDHWRNMHYDDSYTGALPNKVGVFDVNGRLGVLNYQITRNLLPYFINDTGTAFTTLRLIAGPVRTLNDLYMIEGHVGDAKHQRTNTFDFNKIDAYCTLTNIHTKTSVRIVPLFEQDCYTLVFMDNCKIDWVPTEDGRDIPHIARHDQVVFATVKDLDQEHIVFLIQHWLAYGCIPEGEVPSVQLH